MTIAQVLKGLELLFLMIIVLLAIVLIIVKVIKQFKLKRIEKNTASNQLDKAEEDAEKLRKIVAIEGNILDYIEAAENTYKSFKEMAKNAGLNSKFGSAKLTDVLNKLKTDCLTSGIEFDTAEWTAKVKRLVDFSKKVN